MKISILDADGRLVDADPETKSEVILAFIDQELNAERFDHLVGIQSQIFEKLDAKSSFEDLTDNEWHVFAAVNDSIAQLLHVVIPKVVSKEVGRERLDTAPPAFAKLDDASLLALLQPGDDDEDRLFREFYTGNFDYESDDSDEEEEGLDHKAVGSKTRMARAKRAKLRKGTRRIYHDVDPPASQIRARMEGLAVGYGCAFTTKDDGAKLEVARAQHPKYSSVAADVGRAERDRAEWIGKYMSELPEDEREKLEALDFSQQVKAVEARIKKDRTLAGQLKSLQKKHKEASSRERTWTSISAPAVTATKGMLDWPGPMLRNAGIHYPRGTWTEDVVDELNQVNDALAAGAEVPASRFVIAQYRGIAYNTNVFDAVARRRSRESIELRLPVYCSSVFAEVDITPSDYYAGAYVGNNAINDLLLDGAKRLQAALVDKRKSGPIALDASVRAIFRNEEQPHDLSDSSRYVHKLRWSEDPLQYSNHAYALQNFYTINYDGFFAAVRDVQGRSSASKADSDSPASAEPGPLDEVLGGLLNAKNPMVSAGYTPRHALRYAYAVKYYTNAEKKHKLFPKWRADDQRATHPYAGKLFISLHPASDYSASSGPLDIVALHEAGEIDVISDILAEREAAFPAYIPANRVVAEHIARYPSFSTPYSSVYLDKYGMSKVDYEAYRDVVTFATSDNTQRAVLDALSEWLVRYHEARVIEMVRRIAAQDGKILVYRDNAGLLIAGSDSQELTTVHAPRGASSNDETHTTLGASLEGRSSEDRDELEVDDDDAEPREAVPLLGIYNGGNECYLNAALQVLRSVDPVANYEQAGGARVDHAQAQRVAAFVRGLTDEAADGTYLGNRPRAYTRSHTLDIRRQLAEDGRIRSIYTQEDACDALLALVGAFDHDGLGFDESSAWLGANQGNFDATRPSKFHRLVEVTTTFELGEAGEATGDEIELADDGTLVGYDTVNILRLSLPSGSLDIGWEALVEQNFAERALVGENRTTARCWCDGHAYPNAVRVRERTRMLGAVPNHVFVQLKRFSGSLADPEPVDRDAPQKPLFRSAKISTLVDAPLVWDEDHALRAFIVHRGETLAGGHYIAYVLVGAQWYEVNDTLVTAMADVEVERKRGYLYYYSRE